MKMLALETATEACSVALSSDGRLVSRFENVGRGHTRRILPMIDEVLCEAGCSPEQIDALACGIGPGSFAGVRIGVGLAKGLALGLDIPVIGIGSLAMLAQAAFDQGVRAPVLAAIDARMGEVYWAIYRPGAQGLALEWSAPCVQRPDEVPRPETMLIGIGSGFRAEAGGLRVRLAERLLDVDDRALPDARAALNLAAAMLGAGASGEAAALEPAYVRNRVALTMREQAGLRGEGR